MKMSVLIGKTGIPTRSGSLKTRCHFWGGQRTEGWEMELAEETFAGKPCWNRGGWGGLWKPGPWNWPLGHWKRSPLVVVGAGGLRGCSISSEWYNQEGIKHLRQQPLLQRRKWLSMYHPIGQACWAKSAIIWLEACLWGDEQTNSKALSGPKGLGSQGCMTWVSPTNLFICVSGGRCTPKLSPGPFGNRWVEKTWFSTYLYGDPQRK